MFHVEILRTPADLVGLGKGLTRSLAGILHAEILPNCLSTSYSIVQDTCKKVFSMV